MSDGRRNDGRWVRVRAADAPVSRGPRPRTPPLWVRAGGQSAAVPPPPPPPPPEAPSGPPTWFGAALPAATAPVAPPPPLVRWASPDDEEDSGWLEPSFDVPDPWVGRRRR
ncbi:hypothetical protein [Streptoalloteichus hindustanus]|uniref:hypothetical protein n=1 Tax=Streptoalloteichus hindustanus TaxID=2017 RepID=UPI0011614591|nr:hypothetical protein [Streptoalloteichus hindustanus]